MWGPFSFAYVLPPYGAYRFKKEEGVMCAVHSPSGHLHVTFLLSTEERTAFVGIPVLAKLSAKHPCRRTFTGLGRVANHVFVADLSKG